METRNVNRDYNKMMQIKARMDAYERSHMGTPSLALQEELNRLLAPYAAGMERSDTPSDIDWPLKSA